MQINRNGRATGKYRRGLPLYSKDDNSSGGDKPARIFNKVVFPEPLLPRRKIPSPAFITRFSTLRFHAPSKDFFNPPREKSGVIVPAPVPKTTWRLSPRPKKSAQCPTQCLRRTCLAGFQSDGRGNGAGVMGDIPPTINAQPTSDTTRPKPVKSAATIPKRAS